MRNRRIKMTDWYYCPTLDELRDPDSWDFLDRSDDLYEQEREREEEK